MFQYNEIQGGEKNMKIRIVFAILSVFSTLIFLSSCSKDAATLTLLGHSTTKIVTKDGTVIYIDPYYDGDYKTPADIVLVTHAHSDHNRVDLITKKDSTIVITQNEALKKEEYQKFEEKGVIIEAVPANNQNHRIGCVGYLISFDGITIYHAGDTSKIDTMANLAERDITYAMYPIDGLYNMGPEEATECANLVEATYNIPMHTSSDLVSFDEENVKGFNPDGKTIMRYGDTISLKTP